MDCNLKQWRDQHQSEIPTSAKIPRLLLEPTHHHHQPPPPSLSEFALPFFVPEPNTRFSNLSAFPDSTNITNRFPRMGCPFTFVQWQELELQALIFKYMIAGADVPAELLQRIKKSFLNTPACYLHYPYQQYHPYQPTMLQSGYWGRSAVDPEPGRCRRTDGKKWRCSRDVVVGQKYCERHVHRGRSRSRKPVEIPTLAEVGLNTANPVAALPLTAVSGGTHFPLSGLSPSIDLLQLSQRSLESKTRNGGLFETQNDEASIEGRSESQLLRHFFDDCPTSHHKSNGGGGNATHLSISMPGNPSSDFSLKLSTGGNGDEPESREGNIGQERPQLNWGTHHVSSMGGPLAEVLRSSTSNSPTSVLHEIRLGSVSETSSVSI